MNYERSPRPTLNSRADVAPAGRLRLLGGIKRVSEANCELFNSLRPKSQQHRARGR